MASPTPNKGYTYPAHGGAVNAWDTPLNTDFDTIDLNVGGYYPVTIGSSIVGVTYNSSGVTASSTATTITPPSSLAANLHYYVSGTITQNVKLVLPNSGGFYVVNNGTTGSFNITVGGATGTAVTVTQGGANIVACDAANFINATSNPAAAQFYTYLGNPNTFVAGTVGATNGSLTNTIWDATNRQLYAVTTTSSLAAATAWTPQLARIVPEGILSVSNNTTTPWPTSDTTGTTISYTPYLGNWTLLSNGTIVYPYQFSQMTLTLTAAQAASQIYDIFLYHNSTLGIISPVIGTGPAWSTATAGAGNRGTGAGTTQLSRLQGVLVNTVQVTLTNGASTYVCPASQGIYLGSIFVDTVAGNVTCHTAWGASRKWGVWNYYNRRKITLNMGLSTASWSYASATYRQSNASATAVATAFMGLNEEEIAMSWSQMTSATGSNGQTAYLGIALNAATSPSNFISYRLVATGADVMDGPLNGSAAVAATLGIVDMKTYEAGSGGAGSCTFFGTQSGMYFTASYNG